MSRLPFVVTVFDADCCPDCGGRHLARLARAEARWLGACSSHQPSGLANSSGWTAKVGDGYGTTAVSGDRLYVHARQRGDEVVWCLDLNDGKPKWRNRYAEPFEEGGGGEPTAKGPRPTHAG